MKDLVLQDIELCKQVAPIMERLGIIEDAYLVERLPGELGFRWGVWAKEELQEWLSFKSNTLADLHYYRTYRQDKLSLGLPEWWFSDSFEMINNTFAYHTWDTPEDMPDAVETKIFYAKEELSTLRGQPQLEATATSCA